MPARGDIVNSLRGDGHRAGEAGLRASAGRNHGIVDHGTAIHLFCMIERGSILTNGMVTNNA